MAERSSISPASISICPVFRRPVNRFAATGLLRALSPQGAQQPFFFSGVQLSSDSNGRCWQIFLFTAISSALSLPRQWYSSISDCALRQAAGEENDSATVFPATVRVDRIWDCAPDCWVWRSGRWVCRSGVRQHRSNRRADRRGARIGEGFASGNAAVHRL